MPSELRVDTNVLRNAGNTLKTISEDFGRANDRGKEVANLLGDTSVSSEVNDLANVIREFDKNWDDRRRKLKEGIDALATATTQMADTFEEVDRELGRAITPDGD